MALSEKQCLSYRFDDVVVERDLFRLLKRDQATTLEPRAFDLLIYLIEHRGRVVEKQELFDQVWKESFVTDNALTQEIKNIRRAIGDPADNPHYIKTFPKHGYCFIADVVEEREPAATSAPCIAVLPFVNLSGTPENDYFCDGLAEELLNSLTRVKDLRVIARTSAFSLRHQQLDVREIGRRLNATTVLEGSVQKTGNHLRVFTQLIGTADGCHIWSERFDRQMDDVFAIQDEITEAIISKLKVKLLADEKMALVKRHTESVDAYHLYLKGRYFWNKRFEPGTMQNAIGQFQKAIEIDPHYALAYSGLADCYNLLGIFQFRAPGDVFPKARETSERALKLDDTLAEAHASLAYTRMLYEWDWQGAEREFKKALAINPNYAPAHLWYAQYLCAMERFDEAIAEVRRAQGLDPISLAINANVGLVLCWARKYKQAREQLERTLELDPHFGLTHYYLAKVLLAEGTYEEAIAEFQETLEKTGGMPLAMIKLGYAYGRSGKKGEAKKMLQEVEAHFKQRGLPSSLLAWIHLGLGDLEKTFQCLNRACDEHSPLLPWLKIYPDFDIVQRDPRFQELLRRLNLIS
jgi:TolB-like protein/Tfp pilus assembly protein PilF